jgi:phosphoglucomutase
MDHNLANALEKAGTWDTAFFDQSTREEVRELIRLKGENLVDSFCSDLEFGTGGLRGKRGVGTNRINKYTIGMATQGLCNYLLKSNTDTPLKFAIAYDSRHQSPELAMITAEVCAANGIQVFLFNELRPTPELSYAIRTLKCSGGVMVTASHNPPEYNGYKAFWSDGAQVVAPHDQGIIAEVRKIQQIDEVKWTGNSHLIQNMPAEMDDLFIEKSLEQCLSRNEPTMDFSMPIVYTALHGTGATLIPNVLSKYGFTNTFVVKEQHAPDGNFSTVKSPNPEEAEALKMALALAEKVNANLVLGTDPDADRVGVAARDNQGNLRLLNGNETGALLVDYVLSRKDEAGLLKDNDFIVSTVVTSELIREIAQYYGVKDFVTLTGFKHIASVIGELEGKERFLVGGEESYGYMIGDFVRDKDAVTSCLIIAEMAAWHHSQGKTLYDQLELIHSRHQAYLEHLISIKKEGISGQKAIQDMMHNLRSNPPKSIAGSDLIYIDDLKTGVRKQLISGQEMKLDIPKSNVIQMHLSDGSKISARPSGTEPKIKFYISVQEKVEGSYELLMEKLSDRIAAIAVELNVN